MNDQPEAVAPGPALAGAAPAGIERPFKPFGSPPSFDFDEYKDSFEVWLKQWEIFLALSTIDTALPEAQRPAYKTNTLLSCFSRQTLATVLNMGLTAQELANHTAIIAALRDRCNSGRNKHVWRHQFSARKQLQGEMVDNWLCELRDLAQKCEFTGDCCARCEPTRILGQIIYGVHDDEVRRTLLKVGPALTLTDAITALRLAESSFNQASSLREESAVQAIKRSAYSKGKEAKRSGGPKTSSTAAKANGTGPKPSGCRWCGAGECHPKEECPAKDVECRSCGKTGHYKRVCQSKAKPTVKGIFVEDRSAVMASVAAEEHIIVTLAPAQGSKAATVSALPDSGAQIDAIPDSVYRELFGTVHLTPQANSAVTADGNVMKGLGVFEAFITWNPKNAAPQTIASTVHVLCGLRQPVLSKRTQLAMGLLPEGYPHRAVNSVAAPRQQSSMPDQGSSMLVCKRTEPLPDRAVALFSNLLGTQWGDKPALSKAAVAVVVSGPQGI